LKEALFYEKLPGTSAVECRLCPHNCRIPGDGVGLCGARKNRDGVLYAESYGQITSLALDPIEKKPLNRFHPGSRILSVGGYGCNMKCPYCQNHEISQAKPDAQYFSPEKLLSIAKNTPGNLGVAFTYNEPLIGIEYLLDCAPLLKKAGLKVVLVTNGLVSYEPLKTLLLHIDAMNIDVKAFSTAAYRNIGGDLSAVKQTVETCVSACHIEVTALIVPGQNDGEEDMRALSEWLCGLSPDIPLHISRYFPRYKASHPPTPVATIQKLAAVARRRLRYVHLGNI